MSNREINSVSSDEGIPSLTIGAGLANAVAILVLFVLSRFVRTLWSDMAGDAVYWLLAFYVCICFARLRVDLFRWVRNQDTSFILNMIVVAAASFAVITGLRVATSPVIMRAIKLIVER
jgi:hypothetical protein